MQESRRSEAHAGDIMHTSRNKAVVLAAGMLLVLLAVCFDVQRPEVSLASLPASTGIREQLGAELRQQQKHELQLEEQHKGNPEAARIEALVGKRIPRAARARLQELVIRQHQKTSRFAALRAEGFSFMTDTPARLRSEGFSFMTEAPARPTTQTLAAAGEKTAEHWRQRMGRVEKKYNTLLAVERHETALKEKEVRALFAKELKKLQTDLSKKDVILRRDEENAETTILAEKKEEELRKQLEEVQKAAKEKANHLKAQLEAAHLLANKYKQQLLKDKLQPGDVHVKLPAGLSKEMHLDVNNSNNTDELRNFEHSLDQVTGINKRGADEAKNNTKHVFPGKVEEDLAKIKANPKAEAANDKKKEMEKEKERKDAKEAAEEHQKERTAVQEAKKAELAAETSEEAKKERCTEDDCPLKVMDKSLVIDTNSIKKIEQNAEHGHGLAKSQALAMISNLQKRISNDFKHVTGFGEHQEHILDIRKVHKDSASALGQKVALSLVHDSETDEELGIIAGGSSSSL